MFLKKLASAAFAWIAFAATAFSQTTDSIYYENKSNGVWQKSQLDIVTRDVSSCLLTSVLSKVWNESSHSWVNSALSTYTNNKSGSLAKTLMQGWDASNNAWVNVSNTYFAISNEGSKLTYIYQVWDAVTSKWINNSRIVEDFDDKGRATSNELDLYSNNTWEKIQRGLSSYDDNDRIIVNIFQMWMNNEWTNNSKTTHSYTGNGVTFNYLWSLGEQKWKKFARSFTDYLDGTSNAQKILGEILSNSIWQNNFRQEDTYNSNGQTLSDVFQYWDPGMQSWVNSSQLNLDYYPDGKQRYFRYESWDANTNSWSSGIRETYTDINCSAGLQVVPVADVKNGGGVSLQRVNGNYFFYHMPAANTNTANTIQRRFNPLLSNAYNLVYDVIYNNGKGLKQFEVILSSGVKPKSISSNTTNSAATVYKRFVISPNPAKTYFDIDLRNYKNANDITLKLADVSGRFIMQQKMEAGLQRINIASLQKGMYIVTITSGKQVQTQKLIVE